MTRYELLTYLHVGSAIIWLGAGFVIALLILGAERAGDTAREGGYHRDVDWLAPRLFIPASLSTLIFGVLLVIDGPYEFSQVWIQIALGGWLASFGVGILYFKPEGEWIGEAVVERGPDDPEVKRRLRRVNAIDRLQVTVLFVVVADMVIRPEGGDTAVFVVGAAVIAAVAALTVARIRGGADAPAGPDQPEVPGPVPGTP